MTDDEVVKYIREHFVYNKDGTFSRKDRKGKVGCVDKDGYIKIKIKKKAYFAHRLVYAYFMGRFPLLEIDHINRIRSDNRIENIRECDRSFNNKRAIHNSFGIYIDNTDGLKKKYAFKVDGKTYRFYSLEEAIKEKEKLGGNVNYEYL